jgi:Recombinase
LKELQSAGVVSLKGIAAALNERGIPTPAGRDRWYAAQVSRVLKRLSERDRQCSKVK